jgi:flagellin-like hook-associated protein FlgL
MSNIALSSGVRGNLFSLSNTADLITQTQNRLATGKKVNTAIDNPINFFTARSLNSRAGDLNQLIDGISTALKTVEAADNGIRAITKLVENQQAIVRQARNLGTPATLTPLTAGADGATGAALGAGNAGQLSLSFTPTGGSAQNIVINIGGGRTLAQSVEAINGATTNRDANGERYVTASLNSAGRLVLTARNGAVTANAAPGDSSAADAAAESDDEILTALGLGGTNTTGTTTLDSVGQQRQSLARQFNDLRTQITQLARDAGFNGVNLLGADNLTVGFNEKVGAGRAELTIAGVNFGAGADDGSSGLGIAAIDVTGNNGFQTAASLDVADTGLTNALSTLRTQATTFGSQLAVIQTRKEFTSELINTLKGGADALVNANSNEEAANLLTLQTRQQLSSQALALASQQEQSVLRLLG